MQGQQAKVTFKDGVPIAADFDDPYFSLDNGLAETDFVFLDGNDLPARFRDGFHIAELGFGTGLNLLATARLWMRSQVAGRLRFTSFEYFPMTVDDMQVSLTAFPELAELAAELLAYWRCGARVFTLQDAIDVTIIEGDAGITLPECGWAADAWFLDGFSPAKNPELWTPTLMNFVGEHTKPGGTFATYTAAGFVRTALQDAGFDVQRVNGFGRKRHMSVGRKVP